MGFTGVKTAYLYGVFHPTYNCIQGPSCMNRFQKFPPFFLFPQNKTDNTPVATTSDMRRKCAGGFRWQTLKPSCCATRGDLSPKVSGNAGTKYLIRLFWGWVFPYISRIRTDYIGFLHFRYLKCLVNLGETFEKNALGFPNTLFLEVWLYPQKLTQKTKP